MANQQPGLLGRKLGMTQIFEDDGTVVPVTVLEVGPNTVLQVKRADGNDGYNAIQLGFGSPQGRPGSPSRRSATTPRRARARLPPRVVGEVRLSKPMPPAPTRWARQLGAADVFEAGGQGRCHRHLQGQAASPA